MEFLCEVFEQFENKHLMVESRRHRPAASSRSTISQNIVWIALKSSSAFLIMDCISFSIYFRSGFPFVSTFIVQHHCCGRKENVHHWFLCKPTLGGRRLSVATPIRASFCHRTGACRSLSQPLSRVSRKQRYNTLDFAGKVVCQRGVATPLDSPLLRIKRA